MSTGNRSRQAILSWVLLFFACATLNQRLAVAAPITGGTGPGGVGFTGVVDNLKLWLQADTITGLTDGQNIVSWNNSVTHTNASGNATVANTAPSYENAAGDLKNGNPVVNFSGRAAASTGDVLSGTAGTGNFAAEKTLFMVAQQRTNSSQSFCCQGGISTGTDSNGIMPNSASAGVGTWGTDWAGAGDNIGSPNKLGSWAVVSGIYNNATDPRTAIFVDGTGAFTNSNSTNRGVTATDYRLGSRANNGDNLGRFFDGNVGEAVIYNGVLNSAQRIIVENYLSSKWDSSLSANDFYVGDTGGNNNYDRNVFGVGRVDASNLQPNSGAAGIGIEATGGLGDNEFVLAGHRVATNSLTTSNVTVPGFSTRWDRTWYVDETGDVDVTLAFDFSDAGVAFPGGTNYFQLIRSGTDPLLFNIVSTSDTVVGDTVSFAVPGSSLQDGFYTLQFSTLDLQLNTVAPEPASFCLWALAAVAGIGCFASRKAVAKARR